MRYTLDICSNCLWWEGLMLCSLPSLASM